MRDWNDVLPGRIAVRQTANEINRAVARAMSLPKEHRPTYAKIGKFLGVSGSMARYRALKGARRQTVPTPAEDYMDRDGSISELAAKIKNATKRDWWRMHLVDGTVGTSFDY